MIFSIQGVVTIVVTLIVGVVIFGLLDYLIRSAPFVPEPWKATVRWVLLALGILVLIGLLLSFISGTPVIRMQ